MAAPVAIPISSLPALFSFAPNASLGGQAAVSYTLPPQLFISSIHLTLNLCNAPLGYNDSAQSLFTAHTNDSFAYSTAVLGGYANMTIPPIQDSDALTITINGGSDSQNYAFELGITSNPDPPWHILDKLPLFAFNDSDNSTALFTSPTYSSAVQKGPPNYNPLITLSDGVREDLSNSSCYIRSLMQANNVSTSTTTRGVVELTRAEGGYPNETEQGGLKIQYIVNELQPASNYSMWGLAENESSSRLYGRQFFATKRADNCRLITDASFCPDVAYSVPAPPDMSDEDLLALYESSISPLIDNFNQTLSTFPCNGDLRKRQGMYSSVRTCPQCLSTYTSWLCSIRMPRCTDYDSNPSSDDSVIRTFPRTVANTSRTPSLPSSAFPYSEVPPCIEVCNIVQASCPPLISSSFWCPLKDITLDKSYATPFTEQIAFQNVQGGDDPAWIQKSLDEDDPIIRSQDRWGNVKCNDMGVINLINRRRYSGLTVVASTGFALPSSQVNYVAISLVVLATGLMCFIPL